jgi:hypothetical protein
MWLRTHMWNMKLQMHELMTYQTSVHCLMML